MLGKLILVLTELFGIPFSEIVEVIKKAVNEIPNNNDVVYQILLSEFSKRIKCPKIKDYTCSQQLLFLLNLHTGNITNATKVYIKRWYEELSKNPTELIDYSFVSNYKFVFLKDISERLVVNLVADDVKVIGGD